jgi:hypothetical protein
MPASERILYYQIVTNMSISDWLLGTKTIKNLGDLNRQSWVIGGTSQSVLLTEKRGERKFTLRKIAWLLVLFGASDLRLSFEGASRLREFIDESERIAHGESLRSDGPRSLWGEQVIADFGLVEQESSFGRKRTIRAVLIERNGRLSFQLRRFSWFLTSASWNRDTLTLEQAYKLREYIDQGERIAKDLPPSSYDPQKELISNCVLITLIGIVIALFVSDIGLLILVAWIMLMAYLGQTRILKGLAKTGSFVWTVFPLSMLAGFIALGARALLLIQ